MMKISNCGMMRVLERGGLMSYFLCQDSRSIFVEITGRCGGQPDLYRSYATTNIHTTTNFKTSYIIYIWVDLKLN